MRDRPTSACARHQLSTPPPKALFLPYLGKYLTRAIERCKRNLQKSEELNCLSCRRFKQCVFYSMIRSKVDAGGRPASVCRMSHRLPLIELSLVSTPHFGFVLPSAAKLLRWHCSPIGTRLSRWVLPFEARSSPWLRWTITGTRLKSYAASPAAFYDLWIANKPTERGVDASGASGASHVSPLSGMGSTVAAKVAQKA
jgi:hypothetical protein